MEKNLQKKLGSVSAHGKKTHTIGQRTFHYVKAGTVKHKQSAVSEIANMQRLHFPKAETNNLLKVGELTCVRVPWTGAYTEMSFRPASER